MKKTVYTITQKSIPNVTLISLTGQTWYDSFGNIDTGITTSPNLVFNVTGGTIDSGYYIWNDINWVFICNQFENDEVLKTKLIDLNSNLFNVNLINNTGSTFNNGYYEWISNEWKYLGVIYDDINLPIFLDSSVDEFGPMVGFDGNMSQENYKVNFSYDVDCTTQTITIYNTTYYGDLKQAIDATFNVDWGDGTYSGISANSHVTNTSLADGTYDIKITMDMPFMTDQIIKTVVIGCVTPTPTPTVTQTSTSTNTPTPSVTLTATPTTTPSNTPTPTVTPTNTNTPTVTTTSTPTNTTTPTNTSTPTNTPTPTNTVTPTNTNTPRSYRAFHCKNKIKTIGFKICQGNI